MYPVYSMINDLVKAFDSAVSDETAYRNGVSANVFEKEDSVIVRAVLAGVENSDVSVEMADNILIIRGERKASDESGKYLRRERLSGKFEKTIKIPYRIDREKMTARLTDGVLTVELFKSESAKPKKIEII